MSDRSQMLYLLHAERRLLDQVYQRRYRSLGLSWEAALRWVQAEPDRIARLLTHKILFKEGNNLRLSPIIQQFWEQWEGEMANVYVWAKLQADWQDFEAQILQSAGLLDTALLRHWVAQIKLWQQFLVDLPVDTLNMEQLNWLHQRETRLASYTEQKLGFDRDLDRELLWLRDSLQVLLRSKRQDENKNEMQTQIAHLQKLREKDLLFVETDIEDQMLTLTATLWNVAPNHWLWPSLRTES